MVYLDGGSTSSRFGSPAFWPMLVRRMATVTISAPLASMARRVSSKSLYLPVPISSRERNLRPATTKASSEWALSRREAGTDMSTSSYRHHDLELVALREADF